MLKPVTLLCVAILIGIATTSNFAQGKYGQIGKLFKATEAKILFGKVIGSVQIDVDELKEAVANAKDYILFNVKNDRVYITNEKRKGLSRKSLDANENDEMFFFSKSKVEEFLNLVGDGIVRLERRPNNINTLSIYRNPSSSNLVNEQTGYSKTGNAATTTATAAADVTLEMSAVCPPICFD